MIGFWCLLCGVLLGGAIGVVHADELRGRTLPPSTCRRIKRAQRAARADLRRALGRRP